MAIIWHYLLVTPLLCKKIMANRYMAIYIIYSLLAIIKLSWTYVYNIVVKINLFNENLYTCRFFHLNSCLNYQDGNH